MIAPDEDGPSLPPAHAFHHWPAPSDGPSVYVPVEAERDESIVDLTGIAAMLWRRKWTIGLFAVLALAVAGWLTLRMPEVFQSTATVLIQERPRSNESALEVLEGVGTTDNPVETETRLITSGLVLQPVVQELSLHISVATKDEILRPRDAFTAFSADSTIAPASYIVLSDERGGYRIEDGNSGEVIARSSAGSGNGLAHVEFGGVKLGIDPGDAGIGGVVNVGSVIKTASGLRGSVWAGPVTQDANLVMITCSANQAEDAQSLCRAVSESYIRLRSQMERANAEAAATFLRGQVEEVGRRLAAAEDSLGAYEERNMAIALDQRASSAVNQYSALKLERERFESERTALAGLLRELDQPGGDGSKYRDLATFPGFAAGGNPVVSRLMQNLIELEDRRSQLAITRTDRNPDIVAIDARIAEVEDQLRSYGTSYEQSLGKQVSALEGAMGRTQGQLSGIPTKQVASGRLLRQVNLLQENYHFLQTRLREAEVARSVDLPAVQLVDQASLPGGPSSPDVRTNLLLGLLMGLGLGTMIALYREYTDSRIRDRKDVERHTGVPVLGLIPSVKTGGPLLPVANGNGSGGLLAGGSKRSIQDARGGMRPRTMDAQLAFEAFRSLLMDMSSAGVDGAGNRIRSVAVTSSTRGDGKTFTACNLAIASAAQGRRTLLIDADLRARGVGRFFKLPWAAPGLVEVLKGHREYQGVLNDLDIIGDHSSLHVLPSGNHEPSLPGILERMSSQLESFIQDAESSYDLVVVDTPPLNVVTDAATIATRADAVLVVVRGGVTDRDALDITLKRLRLLHTNVLGIVLNDVHLPEYYTSYSVSPEDEV